MVAAAAQKKAEERAHAHAVKLGEITIKVATLRESMVKVPFKTETERQDVERSLAGHKTMLEAAKITRDQTLGKFRANFPAEYASKSERYWADPECPGIELPDAKKFHNYTYDKYMDMRRLAMVLNKALADVRLHASQIKLMSNRVDGYAEPSMDIQAEFKKLRERLSEIDATPEEIDATGINGPDHSNGSRGAGFAGTSASKKYIVLKDGTTIPVKSFIILETEITYTDSEGQPNTVNRDLVDKTVR